MTVASRWLMGAAFAAPPQSGLAWSCFLFPFIEPDSQISRIRLSEKLAEVPGLGVDSAQQIIAEVGVQASTFPSAAELTSWVGTCPGKDESAEENHSSRSAKGNKYLRRVLNQAAHAAVKKKGSHFQVVFRRLLPRLGYQSAIWAVAHRLCRMVWKILHEGVRFIEQGVEPDPKAKNKRARTLARALRKLGYEVTITPINVAIAQNGMQI